MRLSLRTQRFYYSAAICGCLAGAGAIVTWGIQPKALPGKSLMGSKGSAASVSDHDERLPQRGDFARVWDKPLRRPLYDPPPPKIEVKQLPPLSVELLGTIIEEANSMALVRSDRGSVEYKRVGDTIGPSNGTAKILEIAADSILVERSEERITLTVNNKTLR